MKMVCSKQVIIVALTILILLHLCTLIADSKFITVMKQESILLDLLRVVSHHRARLATPIRTVQKIYSEADLENVPYADTIFASSRAAANRFLLIEPSYKIKSEDKVKSPARPTQSEENDAKVEIAPTSDPKAGSLPSAADSKGGEASSASVSNPITKSEGTSTVHSSVQSSNEEHRQDVTGDTYKKVGKSRFCYV